MVSTGTVVALYSPHRYRCQQTFLHVYLPSIIWRKRLKRSVTVLMFTWPGHCISFWGTLLTKYTLLTIFCEQKIYHFI